jgi:hypothetical protein
MGRLGALGGFCQTIVLQIEIKIAARESVTYTVSEGERLEHQRTEHRGSDRWVG